MSHDDQRLNLPKREEKILEFWERNGIFEKTLQKTKGGPRFVFYEGPPTANAAPGIHHVEARSFKDVIPRYQTMRGFYVERKAGWDTHGLPVEIQVEKALGLNSKKDIERYGIAKFNAKCRESVWQFKTEWEKLTKRIGFWLDLSHPYITYETSYIETLWWVIKEIWKKKLLYKDFKVVPWCPRCQTALSTHELGLGYETVKDRSVYVRFRVKAKAREWQKSSILSWTTTPWTLPGNVALAVNPRENYVCIPDPDFRGRWVVLSEKRFRDLVEKHYFPPEYSSSLRLDDIDTFKGQEMVGLEYEPLFNVKELASPKSRHVYAADFVTMDEGTGVVHTAVMYGEDDYRLGTKAGLPKFHTVTETGHFRKEVGEGLGGHFVKDPKTENKIIESLKRRGLLFKEELYEHEYPFCWRCGTPVLYYARQAWWVKMSAVKKSLVANNDTINWVPDYLKRGRFGEFLREVRDWAFSRERYWGTPLPIWQCMQCDHREFIGSLDELARLGRSSGNRYLAMRHGQSEAQLLGIADDDEQTFHLTPNGKSEVLRQVRRLAKEKFDLIIASPVRRTQESAKLLSKTLGVRMMTDRRLREIHIGTFEHQPPSRYHRYYSSTLEKFSKRPPEGESLNDLKVRLMSLMQDLEKKHRAKRVLLVSHEYPIWILWGASQGLSDAAMARVKDGRRGDFIRTAGVLEVPFRPLPRDESGEVNLHRPFIDTFKVVCPKCRGSMARVPEVADVWFDSGAMPFAQAHYPFGFLNSRKPKDKSRTLPYPADYICEGVDQTRGWFYTLLAVSTLLGRGTSYKNVISLGHVLDKNGQKMSKSKGNIVEPFSMVEKYGADTIRWYFYTVNAPGDPKRFDEKDLLLKLRGTISTLWNSFVFFDTYTDKTLNSKPETLNKFKFQSSNHVLDRWVMAKIDTLTAVVTERLEDYDIVGAARLLDGFIGDDFSNWYLRRSRRRFQKPSSAKDKEEAAAVTAFALLRLSELMAPFTPFLAEIIYRELKPKLGTKEESVHLREWPAAKIKAESRKTKALFDGMAEVRRLAALARDARARAGVKVRQPLQMLRIKEHESGIKELLDVLREEVNVKEVVADPKIKGEVELDTTITPELHEEGMMRELVRNIQEMRRDAGFKPQQSIRLQLHGDRTAEYMVERWEAFLRREAGLKAIQWGGKRDFTVEREVKISGAELWLGLRKA